MRGIVIHEASGLKVTSYGNGTSYTVERTSDGASLHFQGDDAGQFREEVDNAERLDPSRDGFAFVIYSHGYDVLFTSEGGA